jgi:hypothetical protein
MNVKALKLVRSLWNVPNISKEQNRHNQKQWVKAVRMLGVRWLLAESLTRRNHGRYR